MGQPFWVYRHKKPDLGDPVQGKAVAKAARDYVGALRACDGMTPEKVKTDSRYRRIMDGAIKSLGRVPEAVETKDGGLLYRLLIELRSFDRLLYFRFG